MNIGVVYQFKTHHKVNGTLFYCFEYAAFLHQYHPDVRLFLVDASEHDVALTIRLFTEKYNYTTDLIVPIKRIDLYKLKLDRTLVLDINTFNSCKEFLTGDIMCFSNTSHDSFRYSHGNRTVTYYGSYPYQTYDEFCFLKLNFDIFKCCVPGGDGVFVSSVNTNRVDDCINDVRVMYPNKPIIAKAHGSGVGNIFDLIDTVHYVHGVQDTNNRIVPEAFFHNKTVVIDMDRWIGPHDSVIWRYNDISANGLSNYTLTSSDVMVQACLK